MIVSVANSFLSGRVNAITSKSFAHRVMICDFICGISTDISTFNISNDILATKSCLDALRCGQNLLDAGESGSTLRFIIPLLGALGGDFFIKTHGKLSSRPNDDLFSTLSEGGVTAYVKDDTICVSGKLKPGTYSIKADVSSQFVSGLLMALSALKGRSTLILLGKITSRPYIDITVDILRKYGVSITELDGVFTIDGANIKPVLNAVEGDWSNSAFFIVAGAINGDVTVDNLNLNSIQGDRKILDVIKLAGGTLVLGENSVTVKKSKLNSFSFDAENVPDLVPICAVLASYCNGVSEIKNVSRLKFKESDRIVSTSSMLSNCGIKCEYVDGTLKVYGGTVVGGKVDSFNDHRIVMSASVLSLGAKDKIIIDGAQAVEKSYPLFFNDFKSIGGVANEIL